jgi:hypothetical protein
MSIRGKEQEFILNMQIKSLGQNRGFMCVRWSKTNFFYLDGADGAETSTFIFLSPVPKKLRDEKKTAANIATITTSAIAHTTLLPVLFPSSAILPFLPP